MTVPTVPTVLAPLLAAAALLCFPPSGPVALARERPEWWGAASLSPRMRRAATVGVAVAAVITLFGLWPWWIALPVGGAGGAVTLRLPQRKGAADREVDRHRLAVHADLLAACLDAGMSVGPALQALAGPALRPAGRPGSPKVRQQNAFLDPDDPLVRLDAVAALLLLGADPERAWQGVQEHPDLAALASAARRTAAGGATFAEAVREHAVALRASAADASERSAGRAGVAITAPLGLCFLPAFLCLGLAPVVVGLLSSLHLF